MRRILARAALAACTCVFGCYPEATNRAIFASQTYSTTPESPVPPNVSLALFAQLQLETSGKFFDPKKAAACFTSLDTGFLASLGATLSKTTSSDAWANDLRSENLPSACTHVDPRDQTFLRYVVGRIATVTEAIAEDTIRTMPDRDGVFQHAVAALAQIAPIVAQTPPAPAGFEQDTVNAPALALSGGSANGAFTAGFLFELLSVRERVLRTLPNRVAVDRRERFGTLAGTSVGSLISQLLDLYFVDEETPLTQAQQHSLDTCLEWWRTRKSDPVGTETSCFDGYPEPQLPGPIPPSDIRRPQACALTNLFRYFTDVTEGDLMCVEPGPITQLLGALGQPRPNMMRFDPMQTKIVGPLLKDLYPVMLGNSTTRVVVSVEMEQNQILGLDERACVGAPDPANCLASGVMASVVLPFFARPVRMVRTGFSSLGTDCGTWFDGGLRSGFPVERAIRMTRPHEVGSTRANVLAIATERLNGLPSPRPFTLMSVAMDAVGEMSGQNFLAEAAMAEQTEELRQRAYAILSGTLRAEAPSPPQAPRQVPEALSSVVTVYVPTEVPQQIVAESGYSFDPYVMRGLFVWGRREALRRMWAGQTGVEDARLQRGPSRDEAPLCERLGWDTIGAEAQRLIQADAHMLHAWSKAYSKDECEAHHKKRMTDGQARIANRKIVQDCADVTSKDAPPYFVCPR